MTTILTFPDKKAEEKKFDPLTCLQSTMDAINGGHTTPRTMIIAWSEDIGEDGFGLRYTIAGEFDTARVIGLLEMTKLDIME